MSRRRIATPESRPDWGSSSLASEDEVCLEDEDSPAPVLPSARKKARTATPPTKRSLKKEMKLASASPKASPPTKPLAAATQLSLERRIGKLLARGPPSELRGKAAVTPMKKLKKTTPQKAIAKLPGSPATPAAKAPWLLKNQATKADTTPRTRTAAARVRDLCEAAPWRAGGITREDGSVSRPSAVPAAALFEERLVRHKAHQEAKKITRRAEEVNSARLASRIAAEARTAAEIAAQKAANKQPCRKKAERQQKKDQQRRRKPA
jgi:hypothetical protein